MRTLLGFLQGAVIAGAVAIGLHFAFQNGGIATWISMLLAGALVGITTGNPIWKKDAWPANIVKAIFGIGLGALANFLLDRFAGLSLPMLIPGLTNGTLASGLPNTLANLGDNWIGVAAFGGLWGLLVGLDSGFEDPKPDPNANKKK